jgi:hypothetical protein
LSAVPNTAAADGLSSRITHLRSGLARPNRADSSTLDDIETGDINGQPGGSMRKTCYLALLLSALAVLATAQRASAAARASQLCRKSNRSSSGSRGVPGAK